jgi:hypothetical protein
MALEPRTVTAEEEENPNCGYDSAVLVSLPLTRRPDRGDGGYVSMPVHLLPEGWLVDRTDFGYAESGEDGRSSSAAGRRS